MQVDELAQFHATFFEESREHVRTLEERLLELEARPGDLELLNALFRAAHSIKGSSGVLGFVAISHLTHAMENVLDAMRECKLAASPALTNVLLQASDLLGACITSASSKHPDPDIKNVVAALDAAHKGHGAVPVAKKVTAGPEAPGTLDGPRLWTILFRPNPGVFALGLNPALVLRDLATLGTLRTELLVDRLSTFDTLDPEQCQLGWRLELETEASEATIRECFMFVEDVCELTLSSTDPAFAIFTPILSADPNVPAPPTAAEHAAAHGKAHAETSTLRVATDKVDRLVNLVGELVISQAMIMRSLQDVAPAELPKLREAVADMERHTRDLQDRVLNIRMVQIGSIFGRFRRLVRDLSASLGKDIHLVTSGDDVELDKSMVEHLADPLTHLVRNASDHGLETPEERLAAGKAGAGTVTLSARHQGGNVIVDISDDGRGLNTRRILARAIERGLVAEGHALSDEQIHELIFAPGFSTAEAVTDLSGRGVGMDVVKRSIEGLNGTVALSSTAGQGSRVRLTLPLTLAILDGMATRVGESTFVLPLNQVIETLSLTRSSPVKQLLGNGEIMIVRGETLPVLRLSRLLNVVDDGASNARPLAVVLEAGELRFALVIDELLGKSQYVIKSLEPNFSRVEGLLGATILGDGTVSFILDVQALARMGNLRAESAESAERIVESSAATEVTA
jgi:two-component system chemotaxis sensor kinase CheA